MTSKVLENSSGHKVTIIYDTWFKEFSKSDNPPSYCRKATGAEIEYFNLSLETVPLEHTERSNLGYETRYTGSMLLDPKLHTAMKQLYV